MTNLVEQTLASELDLSEYALDKGDDQEEEAEDGDEEEDEEEGSDEEEEEAPEEDKKIKVSSAAPNATAATNSLNHGRDAHGMFKNHPNYVKLRNKMNSQEIKHSGMFELINQKLVDQEFFKKATHHEEPEKPAQKKISIVQTKNITNMTEFLNVSMTDEDAACYAARYKDLNGVPPKDHFYTVGAAQGRLGTCAKSLSDIETQVYIDRHPDLQSLFGKSGPNAFTQARAHYQKIGFK